MTQIAMNGSHSHHILIIHEYSVTWFCDSLFTSTYLFRLP